MDRDDRIGAALTDHSVALIVKRPAAQIGFDAAGYSGQPLRAGLATAAAAHGAEERAIACTAGYRSIAVLRTYLRDGELFVGNAFGRVGL